MTSAEVSPDSVPPVSDGGSPVEAPAEAPIELDRMRRNVRAQLFGGPAEPTRIGRFRLLQCIGRGGMGVVWSAHDDKLDRTVAIKLLRPEVAGHDLTAEARALARLSHPNVVSVFDVGEHEGQRFIAMEFVQGDTLRVWLSQPRSVADVVDVFLAAGQGLSAAHAVGLVHRDFKPDNVLVGDDGRPRVLDFGLARRPDLGGGEPPVLPSDANPFATTMTQAGLLLGTPAYMAPEQHLGDPADARSDQFAFAVALFEGLTGVLPFQGGDLRALSLSIVAGRIHEPPGGTLSPQLRTALARALSQDPSARFPDIDTMLRALRSAVASSDVSFNTREVDQVLARAAELQAAAPSRPGLSAAELEAVAVEVGIDASHVRRAAGEAVLTPSARVQEPGVLVSTATAPPARSRFLDATFAPEVSVTRQCGPVSAAVTQLLVRRMESRMGGGKVEQLGASASWRGGAVELHIDPKPGGTELTLQRQLGVVAKTRPWRYGVMGAIVGVATIVPLFVETFAFAEAIVVSVVFGSIATGGLLGRRFAHWLHERDLAQQRRELGGIADRLVALAAANEHVV